MKYLKLFEGFKLGNNICIILNKLPNNKEFITYLKYTKSFPIKLTKKSLIEGYCNDVTVFIKWLFPECEMLMSDDHSFVKFRNKYYDGYNYNGVKNYNDLYFFKLNKCGLIKSFEDKLGRIDMLNKLFDETDKIEIINNG